MIQPNEIRIGNIVNQLPVTETAQSGMGSIVREGGEIVIDTLNIYFVLSNPESVDGVPLTEEWLLRFGFEEYPHDHEKAYLKDFVFINKEFRLCEMDGSGYEWIYIGKPLEHIHQLQNLYFALTGEELTVKTEVSNGKA